MNTATAERVALGAAWLDEHFPDWWKSIDLATLELSNCDLCVLGQVYSGHIPAHEKSELLAQALSSGHGSWALQSLTHGVSTAWYGEGEGGYQVLTLSKGLIVGRDAEEVRPAQLGFALGSDGCHHTWEEKDDQFFDWYHREVGRGHEQCVTFAALTDEWTRVIISRRLAAHPDVATEFSNLGSIEREPVTV